MGWKLVKVSLLIASASCFALTLSLSTHVTWPFSQGCSLMMWDFLHGGWLPRGRVEAARYSTTCTMFLLVKASHHASPDLMKWDRFHLLMGGVACEYRKGRNWCWLLKNNLSQLLLYVTWIGRDNFRKIANFHLYQWGGLLQWRL